VKPDRKAAKEFATSIGRWPVHADVPNALAYLKEHFRLVILTNTDHASFDCTAEALGVTFDAVYTAEDVGSYKPNSQNFAYLLKRIREAGIAKRQALHVAGSLRFDHVPAKRLGMRTCWIHRGRGHPQSTAMRKRGLDVTPDFHFDSLSALVDVHRAEIAAA
jgi:2-haloalkanoic acid dehalogenase type II